MRILLLHNRYRIEGGEDRVVEQERCLLQSRGHEVRMLAEDNANIKGLRHALKVSWQLPYSSEKRRLVARSLREWKPDVVHVHNFFPLLTPSLFDACREEGVPVVQTLHNYRLACPNGLLLREQKPCEECVGRSAFHAIRHRCYRGSTMGTLAVARMLEVHRRAGTWVTKVDRFLALTQFGKDIFVRTGIPEDRITVKPNCLAEIPEWEINPRHGALFVGRLSEEKGIDTLLGAWESLDVDLTVVGGGDPEITQKAKPHSRITMKGTLPQAGVYLELRKAAFLILPSICYEGFPLIVVEAFAHGVPVIASRLGAMKEIVEEGVNGLLFEPGNPRDLRDKVQWANQHPEEMRRLGEQAREHFMARYTPDANYRGLMQAYSSARECRQKA